MTSRSYDAVLFDLLTALLDSWSLWNRVAGSGQAGQLWRAEYLRLSYQTGPYRPYEDLVADAAEATDLPRALASQLAALYPEIEPWPEACETLAALDVPLGIVTNCSESLGHTAAARLDTKFSTIVTAERAGFYKPHSKPYRLALHELGVEPARCLFVAGSPYDLFGTAQLGLPTFWHDRLGMAAPPNTPKPLVHHCSLTPLRNLICA